MRLHSRDARGFTLIEVMFSVVFLAIGLLGIAALEDIALARNVDARRISAATNAAAEMLERIRFNSPLNSTVYPNAAIPPQFLYNGVIACASAVAGVPSAVGAPCSAAPPCPGAAVATAGNTGASVLTGNGTAAGDYTQWGARLTQLDSNGVPLLPCAVGTVNSIVIGPAGPGPTLGQVQVIVSVAWSSGLRTPTIFMSTIVAPM